MKEMLYRSRLFAAVLVLSFPLIASATMIPSSKEVYVAAPEKLEIIEIVDPKPPTIDDRIGYFADIYGVDEAIMRKVVHCESRYNPLAVGDSGASRGLVQIHKTYHPEVTDAMAFDVDYALEFLAKKLSQGKGHLWTCFRL